MSRRQKVSKVYRENGWPLNPGDYRYPGLKLCGTQNIAPCHDPAVWRIERADKYGLMIGYRCDQHLPPELREVR